MTAQTKEIDDIAASEFRVEDGDHVGGDADETDVKSPRSGRVAAYYLWGAVALAHAPSLFQFSRDLYRYRPHYEFAPALLISAVWIALARWPQSDAQRTRDRATLSLNLGLLVTSACVLAVGTLLNSPWAGAVSAVISCGAWGCWAAGRQAWRELLPCWSLLWLIIPPPLNLDSQFISKLQSITSHRAAEILDWRHVTFLRLGNVFQLADTSLFVAEACSGIHSQLVLMAVACIIWVARRRGFVHGALLAFSASLWSLAANVTRIVIVVWAESRGVTFATGWRHDAIGFGLIAIGMIALLSTDQLLTLCLGPIEMRSAKKWLCQGISSAKIKSGEIPLQIKACVSLCQIWNRLLAGPRERSASRGATTRPLPAPRMILTGFTAIFAVIGALQILVLAASPPADLIDASELYARVDEELLPSELGMLRRRSHDQERRDRSSDEGEFTHSWEYDSNQGIVRFAMDFPFRGWHELQFCYVANGWKIESESTRVGDGSQPPVREFILRQLSGGWACLHYSLNTADGRPVPLRDTASELRGKLHRNPLVSLIRGTQVVPMDSQSLQFQRFQTLPSRPTQEELEASLGQFERMRDEWLQSPAFPDSVNSKAP